MSRCLSIPPEGACIEHDEPPADVARQLLDTDSLDVITARGIEGETHVMHIDDWGRAKGLALNRRAWALYGGSPVYGTAVLSTDSGQPLERRTISAVTAPGFPGSSTNAAMDRWLAENEPR